jgi:hypothetical protein
MICTMFGSVTPLSTVREHTYWVSGDEGFGEYKELDVVCCSLFDELDSLLDSSRLVHEHRCSMSCSHLELGLLWWRHLICVPGVLNLGSFVVQNLEEEAAM